MELILLLQFNENLNSRDIKEFQSMDSLIEYFFDVFEEYYITTESYKTSSNKDVMVLDLKDYLTFLYLLHDFGILEFNKNKDEYDCYGKDSFSFLFIDYIERCKGQSVDVNQQG